MNNLPNYHYFGPKEPDLVVIYVHGLGVDYASRGLFTGLAQGLSAEDIGSLLFDISDYRNKEIHLQPLEAQVASLQAIVNYAQQTYRAARIAFLGHSFGCLVLGQWLSQQPRYPLILLAPARLDVGVVLEPYLRKRRGAYTDEQSRLCLPRQSGGLSIYPPQYFRDLANISPQLYLNLPLEKSLIVLSQADYQRHNPKTWADFTNHGAQILESDHNFSDKQLVLKQLVSEYLFAN